MAHLFTTNHCPIRYGNDTPPVPSNLPAGQQGAFLRSSDNCLWLFQRQWIPASGDILATLMVLHGTVDHSGVYHELAMELNKVGIAVFASDMRGWGLSDGESLYFHDMNTFVADVEDQYSRIQQDYPQVKYHFLLGKSIGGLLAAYTCCSPNIHNLNGLIGLSGAFAIDEVMIPSAPVMAFLYSLSILMPKLPLKPLMDSSMLVSDETAQEEWKKDPLVRRGKLTVGYLQELLHCTTILEDNLKEAFPTNMPVLMLWGTDDKVVTHAGHELMCSVSKSRSSLKTFPGGRHNLLAEPSLKEQVITDIRDWILLNCNETNEEE